MDTSTCWARKMFTMCFSQRGARPGALVCNATATVSCDSFLCRCISTKKERQSPCKSFLPQRAQLIKSSCKSSDFANKDVWVVTAALKVKGKKCKNQRAMARANSLNKRMLRALSYLHCQVWTIVSLISKSFA